MAQLSLAQASHGAPDLVPVATGAAFQPAAAPLARLARGAPGAVPSWCVFSIFGARLGPCQHGASREFREEAPVRGAACRRRRLSGGMPWPASFVLGAPAGLQVRCSTRSSTSRRDSEMRSLCGSCASIIERSSSKTRRWAVGGRRRRALGTQVAAVFVGCKPAHWARRPQQYAPTSAAGIGSACTFAPCPLACHAGPAARVWLGQFRAASFEASTRQCCAAAQWVAQRLAASYRARADFKEQDIVQVGGSAGAEAARGCAASRARCAASPALPPQPLPCCCLVSPSLTRPALCPCQLTEELAAAQARRQAVIAAQPHFAPAAA